MFFQKIEKYTTEKEQVDFAEKYINDLYMQIIDIKEFCKIELLFEELGEVQFFLSKLAFKYNVELPIFLREFVYDYDRVDDYGTRLALYQKLIEGKRISVATKINSDDI